MHDPLSKFIRKNLHEFKQFQFVRIVPSASKPSYTDDTYVWSIYGETNCIGPVFLDRFWLALVKRDGIVWIDLVLLKSNSWWIQIHENER